ncbi:MULTISPECIES: hypothetical protein [unclassified Leifsonia]|uniref:hypothetical protein n=1 Tax=unclassified Leifsonia TaxID=2663824 RepID=UPI0003A4F6C6|nr:MULTISPECIES: hypothetical protein [unclassified Leifsonia]TDQ02721.1 hypothetical protein AXZ95_0996 [Leifsonia sp. 115AMFTsu3.1]
MNGELAALVALCLYGNDWVSRSAEPAPALDASNSAFRFVSSWRSQCSERGLFRHRSWEGDGVAAWLQHVKEGGSQRLTLLIGDGAASSGLPGHIEASFANGGRWAICTDGPRPRIWFCAWSVRDRADPNNRIWAVEMTSRDLPAAMEPVVDLGSARTDLRTALQAIERFAQSTDLRSWAGWFAQALGLLDTSEPVIPYNPDLAPSTAPTENRQLLAAAVQAWVFGGMGSWNDLVFQDEAQQSAYLDVTRRLYATVLTAIATAANTAA